MAIQEAPAPNAPSKESSPQTIARELVSSILKHVPHPIHRKQYTQTFLESQCTSFLTQKQAEGTNLNLNDFVKKTAKHLLLNSLNVRKEKGTKLWKRGQQKQPNFVDFPAERSSPAQRVVSRRGARGRVERKLDIVDLGQMRVASGRAENDGQAGKRVKTVDFLETAGGPAAPAPLGTQKIEQYDAAMEGIEPKADSSATKEEAHVRGMAELSVQNRGLKRTFCERAVEPVRIVKRLRSDVSESTQVF